MFKDLSIPLRTNASPLQNHNLIHAHFYNAPKMNFNLGVLLNRLHLCIAAVGYPVAIAKSLALCHSNFSSVVIDNS